MKAIAIQAFGAPEGLAIVDLPDPIPAAGQALISIEAIGVGGVDTVIRSGAVASYGFKQGHILGGEIAGTVKAVGQGVDASWLGRRVWAFTGLGGGYAELAVASAAELVPLGSDLAAIDAVTIGSSGLVAHFALRHAHFARGETVLVRGAAGGIGVMAIQLAARAGAGAVAVTSSSAERGNRLRELGARHVLSRAGEGVAGSPTGYDVIIDIVAGADMPAFFDKLNPNGRMVAVGVVGGNPPAEFGLQMFASFQKSLSFSTFSTNTVGQTERHGTTVDLFDAARRGGLKPVIHEVLALDQAVLAHQKMDAGEVFGRIVLVP